MNDFHGLYERYAKPLYRFAVALSGNAAEAEDLVADAFVRLWTTPGEIREATVQAYLFTIVRNLFLTKRRRASRQVPLEDSIAEDATPIDQRTAAASKLARVRQMLVDEHLKNDASLSALLRGLQAADQTGEADPELPPAVELEAISRTRAMITRRSWTLALAIFFTLLPLTFAGGGSGVTFFMLRDEPGSAWFFVSAAYLWWSYARLTRRLRSTIL